LTSRKSSLAKFQVPEKEQMIKPLFEEIKERRKTVNRKDKEIKEIHQSVSTNILKTINDINRNQR